MIIRQMKTAAVLVVLLVIIVGAIAVWETGSVTANRPAVQRTAVETARPAYEGGKRSITLFFLGRGDHSFREERREIESGALTVENAKRVLAELVKGPKSGDLVPTVPRGAQLLNVFIDASGIAYVDFSQGLRSSLVGGAQEELYAVFSIVNTLTSNFVQITRVQFLVEGAEIPTLAGHVDTRMPLPPQYVF